MLDDDVIGAKVTDPTGKVCLFGPGPCQFHQISKVSIFPLGITLKVTKASRGEEIASLKSCLNSNKSSF